MARMGTFAGASEAYAVPLSFIHPKDNDFEKARFHPILLDARLNLTNKQRRKLQSDIDDLAGLTRVAREKAIAKISTKANKFARENERKRIAAAKKRKRRRRS